MSTCGSTVKSDYIITILLCALAYYNVPSPSDSLYEVDQCTSLNYLSMFPRSRPNRVSHQRFTTPLPRRNNVNCCCAPSSADGHPSNYN